MTTPNIPPIPISTQLPTEPADPSDLLRWVRDFSHTFSDRSREIGRRIDDEIQQGTLAQRPLAQGSRRFFYASDALTVFYDSLAGWVPMDQTRFNVMVYGAKADSSTDNTTAIQAAITAANAAGGGPVFFPPSLLQYRFSSTLTIPGHGITLCGVSAATGGSGLASKLVFTGTGAGNAIAAPDVQGFSIRDLTVGYTSGSFTGVLINCDSVTLSSNPTFSNANINGLGVRTAILLSLDRCTNVLIDHCTFQNAVTAIRCGSHFTYQVTVAGSCNFLNLTTAAIALNAAQGWVIAGNNFENLFSGAAGAITSASNSHGLVIMGNWFGDATVAGGTWMVLQGVGINVIGNTVSVVSGGGATGTTGVKLSALSNGVSIQGNSWEMSPATCAAIDGGGFAHTDIVTFPNNYNSTPTLVTGMGSVVGNLYLSTGGGVGIGATPTGMLHVFGVTDGAPVRFEGNPARLDFYDTNSGAGSRNWCARTGVTALGDLVFRQSTAKGGDPQSAGANILALTDKGSIVPGSAALITTATDGFVYVETCAGVPTGVPTVFTGRAAMVYDTTNHKLMVYDVGAAAWKGILLT